MEGSSGSPGDGHTRPFILPAIWLVNDFKPTMMTNIFKNLQDHYQIPDNIPICLIGMYDAMFVKGLRLPLTALHRQLTIFLGPYVSQIALYA